MKIAVCAGDEIFVEDEEREKEEEKFSKGNFLCMCEGVGNDSVEMYSPDARNNSLFFVCGGFFSDMLSPNRDH